MLASGSGELSGTSIRPMPAAISASSAASRLGRRDAAEDRDQRPVAGEDMRRSCASSAGRKPIARARWTRPAEHQLARRRAPRVS